MIIGVGTDIIEIGRIKRAIERNKGFLEKVFTKAEINDTSRDRSYSSLAGFFAAKEAVAKALGTGFRDFSFRDIEINKDSLGKPMVLLKGKAKELSEELLVKAIHVTISHSKDNAIAFVVLEG